MQNYYINKNKKKQKKKLQTAWNEDAIYRTIDDIFEDGFSDNETIPR